MAAPAVLGIAFMGMSTAVLCPTPDGVCHNLRVMALETKLLPQVWWEKLTRRSDGDFRFSAWAWLPSCNCVGNHKRSSLLIENDQKSISYDKLRMGFPSPAVVVAKLLHTTPVHPETDQLFWLMRHLEGVRPLTDTQ